MASMHQTRGFNRNLYTIKLNKIGLSPFDNKRHVQSDGCDTLPYGYYRIRDDNLDEHDKQLIELLVDL